MCWHAKCFSPTATLLLSSRENKQGTNPNDASSPPVVDLVSGDFLAITVLITWRFLVFFYTVVQHDSLLLLWAAVGNDVKQGVISPGEKNGWMTACQYCPLWGGDRRGKRATWWLKTSYVYPLKWISEYLVGQEAGINWLWQSLDNCHWWVGQRLPRRRLHRLCHLWL